jgi:hypothetical protein
MDKVEVGLRFGSVDFWLPVLAIVLAALVGWQFLSLRTRCSWKKALMLTLVRSAALGMVLFFTLEPTMMRRRLEKFRPAVAVMVDNSRSMGFSEKGGRSRLEKVKEFLSSPAYREAVAGYHLEYYSFSETPSRIEAASVASLEAEGRRTDIGGSLALVGEDMPGSLGALLVFTDGGHEELHPSESRGPEGGDPPVLIVGVGDEEAFKDVEVVGVQSAGMAFAERPSLFTVKMRAKGFSDGTFPLLLKEGGQVLLSREVSFEGGEETLEVEISWTPPRPGKHQLSFEVPPQADEQIKENNAVGFVLEAVRDKIRVLLVCGRPSWNHRFLREALKGDPGIDLVSFIILRTATDAVNVPEGELSLIPFPTKKIFLEELHNFDLVIFENFSYRFYFPVQYLEKIRDFVSAGGGFWMLGGPLSFAAGAYAGTPIEELLPVALEALPLGEGYEEEAFRPELTPEGARHPFFRGIDGVAREEMPLFDGYNLSGPPGAGAAVLVDRPLADGRRQPIMVLGRYGEGRALAFLSGDLWRWNFEMAGKGKGNFLYLSLVRQAIRWSIGDPTFQPVTVRLESDHILPGQKVRADIRVLGEDYLPAVDTELRVFLRREDGSRRILPVSRESPGFFVVEAEVAGSGRYELEATAGSSGEAYGSDSALFDVSWPVREFSRPGLNRKAVERYGGVMELGEVEATSRRLKDALASAAPVTRLQFEEEKNLGDEWWAFLLVVILLGTEWLLRKREGLS